MPSVNGSGSKGDQERSELGVEYVNCESIVLSVSGVRVPGSVSSLVWIWKQIDRFYLCLDCAMPFQRVILVLVTLSELGSLCCSRDIILR
jgi:hypothetical protein